MKRRTVQPNATRALPTLGLRSNAISWGFAREAGVGLIQGQYGPGGQPTLYDPKWTSQRVPEAVLRHEEVHQDLFLETFHGVLTVILSAYGEVASARAALSACLNEQWVVQELGATYAELAFVQRAAPGEFARCVESLPSAAREGEPYREAFDFANRLLPLDEAARHERWDPRTLVIGALCSCSMGTACLRELAGSEFNDAKFAAWITDNSPSARLERIGQAADPAFFLELTQMTAKRLSAGRPTNASVRELFGECARAILGCVPALTVEPLPELQAQAQAAVDRLCKDCPTFVFDITEGLRRRGALFTESPDRRARLNQEYGFNDLETGN